LPKGRLLNETATLVQRADWGLSEYHEKARLYRLQSGRFPDFSAKVFHEKDIPIQVAVGNYDLGICGLDWIEELLVRYPSSALVKVRNLGYGEGALYMVAGQFDGVTTLEKVQAKKEAVRIATEYPNLAESFALSHRLRRFNIFPLWGGAEVYPPESADLVLIPGKIDGEFFDYGLVSVNKVLDFSAFLIANKISWETKKMDELLASIGDEMHINKKHLTHKKVAGVPAVVGQTSAGQMSEDTVWLALPDGHQQQPTLQLLSKSGIQVDDYPSSAGNRRPTTSLKGVAVKVIRPQDMPLQVANGNFDLAITGRDWLTDLLYRFPSSPVTELLDLNFGKVRIVAVTSQDLPVSDIYGLRQLSAERSVPLRVASEYVNVADKYARDNHLGMYKVVPTWGASEAFLPEDADLLIENTQTGRTIAKHNLRIIDTLFESTALLIGNRNSISSSSKRKRIKLIIETLRKGMENS